MVSDSGIIGVIKDGLSRFKAKNIVLDPVMVSKSGCQLLKPEAIEAVKELAAIADIVTPNIPEAQLLCGITIKTEEDMRAAAKKIAGMGAKNVLIKGGHLPGNNAMDLLLYKGGFISLQAARIDTKHTHGTGCTLSSAIACRLAREDSAEEAVRAAKEYITQAIADAYPVGAGHGPVGHLAALYRKAAIEI
jgi:hydroxymethylpyrimidine/phosphomethylpyrimidine kinase